MTSAARTTANRRNAMASTGPRSPEGKQKVSQNARKHGFRSKQVTLTSPQRAEIEASVQSFTADFPHLNQQHAAVFLQLGTAWWYLQHFDKLEDECYKITDIEDVVCHLFTLTRYRARHERLFHQAMATLQTLLANCTIKPNPPVKPEELTQNPFYPIHPIHPSQESFFSGATNPQRSAHGAPTPQINSAICTIKPNPPVKPEKLTQNPFYPIHPSQEWSFFGATNPPAQPEQICTIKPTELPETILRTNRIPQENAERKTNRAEPPSSNPYRAFPKPDTPDLMRHRCHHRNPLQTNRMSCAQPTATQMPMEGPS